MSAETKRLGSIEADDHRLTTYALGEMDDAERTAFEAEIAGNSDARSEIEAIRAAAGIVEAELKRAPGSLGAQQRAAIAAALEKRSSGPDGANVVPISAAAKKRGLIRGLWIAVPAVAAAAAFVFFVRSQATPEMSAHGHDVADVKRSGSASRPSPVGGKAHSDEMGAAAPAPLADGKSDSVASKAKRRVASRIDTQSPGIMDLPPAPGGPVSAESDGPLSENPFVETAKDPQSTFSIDVDTASYAVVRRSIETGRIPPPAVVRVEEMVNYFPYADPAPVDEAFGVTTTVASAPWAKEHRLLRVGLKGRDVPMKSRPASNLVFLLDVSGSMTGPDRLGLVKEGLKLLVRQLDERDHVSIVVYAGAAGLVLPPTPGSDKRTILDALDRLEAGGSTNGGQGIQLAYAQAAANFVTGGTNRVLLATDGDFNVGVAGKDALVSLAQEKAKEGVFLTVLGFGQGNLRDATLEQVADKGNGHYAYIDSLAEAKKVLVDQAAGTLLTIAKDVKIQMTFDPGAVKSFRLVGYENRMLSHQDFKDDKKDAGDIGAGHTVTALYEIVPQAKLSTQPSTQPSTRTLGKVALRFKMPDGQTSREVDFPVVDEGGTFEAAPVDFRFGAAVAGFGMKLRGSKHLGDFGFADAARIGEGALGDDVGGHRRGFVALVQKASSLQQ
jgi:Ca-activated chloride channel family protein